MRQKGLYSEDVYRQWNSGKSISQLARELGVSESTINYHLKRVRDNKLKGDI